jgi:hypothetical protein
VAATMSLYRDKPRRERQSQNAKSFLVKYGWDNAQNGLKNLYDNLLSDDKFCPEPSEKK